MPARADQRNPYDEEPSLSMSNTHTAYRTKDLTDTEKTTDSKLAQSNNSIRPPEQEPEPKPKLIDLSPTQLMGGALAAMTSAVVGARLGVAGTVLGAAVGSIVAGVAGTLYTTSLRRTKDKITSAIVTKSDSTPPEIGSTTVTTEVDAATATAEVAFTTVTTGVGTGAKADAAPPPAGPERPMRRWSWKKILVSAAAVFVLAFAAITTFEIVTGHAISGGQGTTITQVSEGRSSGTSKPSKAPSAAPSSKTSAEPSTSASSDPTSEPTTSTPTTPEPTSTPTPAPSATSEPSAAGGAGAATSGTGTTTTDTGVSSR